MSGDSNCQCYGSLFQRHRASQCAFKGQTKPPKKTKTTQKIESSIDQFISSIFSIPTREELSQQLAAERAKKMAQQKPSPSATKATSCDQPISPCGTEELSPRTDLVTNSVDLETTSDYFQSVSEEESLEPTMPALPSMCTPGAFIPAVYKSDVPARFVPPVDVEGSVLTQQSRTVCDTTQFTQEDKMVTKESDDQITVHTVQTEAHLSPAEQQALLDIAKENQVQDLLEGLMVELEHIVIPEDDDDEVSELGNTYFESNTVLANTDDEPGSVLLAEELQRLQAENFLLKNQSNTLTLLYSQQQVLPMENSVIHDTNDDPSVCVQTKSL